MARCGFSLLLLALVGCRPALHAGPGLCAAPFVPSSRAHREVPTRNVIVVTLDGIRWQELFGGVDPARAREANLPACAWLPARELLPHVYARFVDNGVALGAPGHGAAMLASGPRYVSLPGYLELFSGAPTSCRDNECGAIRAATFVDGLARALALPPEQVAVIASWAKIDRAASAFPSEITLTAGRHAGQSRLRARVSFRARRLFDAAEKADPWPGHDDYRPDRYTAALALEYLRKVQPRLLVIDLGDADEYAHRGSYAGYLQSLRDDDRFLGDLFDTLDGLGAYGEQTTVIVTTDHGRDPGFDDHGGKDSARVWLLAAGGEVPVQGLGAPAEARHLADLAPTVRALFGLSANGRVVIEALFPERSAMNGAWRKSSP